MGARMKGLSGARAPGGAGPVAAQKSCQEESGVREGGHTRHRLVLGGSDPASLITISPHYWGLPECQAAFRALFHLFLPTDLALTRLRLLYGGETEARRVRNIPGALQLDGGDRIWTQTCLHALQPALFTLGLGSGFSPWAPCSPPTVDTGTRAGPRDFPSRGQLQGPAGPSKCFSVSFVTTSLWVAGSPKLWPWPRPQQALPAGGLSVSIYKTMVRNLSSP